MSEIRAVPLGKRAVNSSVRSIELAFILISFYLSLFFSCLGAGQGKITPASFFASVHFAAIIDHKCLQGIKMSEP